jgi:hypothetical protein
MTKRDDLIAAYEAAKAAAKGHPELFSAAQAAWEAIYQHRLAHPEEFPKLRNSNRSSKAGRKQQAYRRAGF